ncbi:MAG: FAD-dependent oxidoreductase [Parvibaculaceae bacterium]|nr:FAD-dependent oxidoreductase [Parvibaculaceae bacterium]
MSAAQQNQTRPTLAIVGGGYLGAELAKALDAEMDVTLIERASHFTHTPAMIRAMVVPDLVGQALVPYDKLLAQGRVVHGEAVAVDGDGISLADGSRVLADYIVVATGSSHLEPFKAEAGDIAGLRADTARWHVALEAARSVLIIGAGAVGAELAGEIAHAAPKKKVTLVASGATLFPDFPAKLGRSLLAKLKRMGVEVILEARAQTLPGQEGPEGGQVTLSTGQVIEADLIVPAVGATPLTRLLEGLPGAAPEATGRMTVDPWMRPSTFPNVFAAGDVAANRDAMTIVAISRQLPWLEKTLKAVAGGKAVETLKPYTPWKKAPILVPLGPKRGSSFLVLMTVGDWVTRTLKGKDLFIAKNKKLLGRD